LRASVDPATIKNINQNDLRFKLLAKRAYKRQFLDETDRTVPQVELMMQFSPYTIESDCGRPAYPVDTMLRIQFFRQWLWVSDLEKKKVRQERPMRTRENF
jgi:hypothetical protein